jgi:hypothetical protein
MPTDPTVTALSAQGRVILTLEQFFWNLGYYVNWVEEEENEDVSNDPS